MAQVTATLVGGLELKRYIDGLEKKHVRAAIRKGTRAGCKVIQSSVKEAIPKRTGAWAQAVKVRATKKSRTSVGTVVTVGAGWFKGETFYAGFVEFGHKVGSRKLGDARKQVEGQHAMERGTKAVQQEAGAIAVARIKYELEATRAKLNG